MDQKFKRALQAAYSAPPPVRRDAFLRHCRRREIGMWELLGIQAGYISKWVWIGSAILLAAAKSLPEDAASSAAFLMPVLALFLVTESGRASFYGMEELELSARFRHSAVVMSRMAVIGAVHLGLLLVLIPCLAGFGADSLVGTGLHLLAPYLASTSLGLFAARNLPGRDGLYGCIGAALLVEAAQYFLPARFYGQGYLPAWGVCLALLAGAVFWQLHVTKRGKEELKWNYSSAA